MNNSNSINPGRARNNFRTSQGIRVSDNIKMMKAKEDLISLIINGEIIENYPDDFPYPSALILGYILGSAFHVVVAKDRSLVEW